MALSQPLLAENAGFNLFFVGIGGLFLLLGLAILAAKVSIFREWFRVKNTPTTTTRAAAVGQADIEGTVRAHEESPESPFTRTEGVYVCWEVSEHSGNDWQPLETGDCTDRLVLEDETGEILVEDPGNPFQHNAGDGQGTPSVGHMHSKGSAVENRTEYTIRYTSNDGSGNNRRTQIFVGKGRVSATTVPSGERPPDRIRDWCDAVGIEPEPADRRRYREFVIPEGETVYVHGQATPADAEDAVGANTDLIVGGNEARNAFLLADRGEVEFVELLRWKWRGAALIGVVFAVLGLLVLLAGLGAL